MKGISQAPRGPPARRRPRDSLLPDPSTGQPCRCRHRRRRLQHAGPAPSVRRPCMRARLACTRRRLPRRACTAVSLPRVHGSTDTQERCHSQAHVAGTSASLALPPPWAAGPLHTQSEPTVRKQVEARRLESITQRVGSGVAQRHQAHLPSASALRPWRSSRSGTPPSGRKRAPASRHPAAYREQTADAASLAGIKLYKSGAQVAG